MIHCFIKCGIPQKKKVKPVFNYHSQSTETNKANFCAELAAAAVSELSSGRLMLCEQSSLKLNFLERHCLRIT